MEEIVTILISQFKKNDDKVKRMSRIIASIISIIKNNLKMWHDHGTSPSIYIKIVPCVTSCHHKGINIKRGIFQREGIRKKTNSHKVQLINK